MAIHISDPLTDALIRKLAAQRNISLTEAVWISAVHALEEIDPDFKAEERKQGSSKTTQRATQLKTSLT